MKNRSSDVYGLPVWTWVLVAAVILSIVFDFDPIGDTAEKYFGPTAGHLLMIGIVIAGMVWVALRGRRRS